MRMATKLGSRRSVAVFRSRTAVALLFLLVVRERAAATPVFAQAHGLACQPQTKMLNEVDFVRGKMPVHAGAYDYSRGAEGLLQWRVADADPAKPYEVGAFGETGALDLSGSARRDPRPGPPSLRCSYASTTGGNPGYVSSPVAANSIQPAGSAVSSWMIGSARQLVEREHEYRTVNFTYYQTSQELGQIGVARLIPPNGFQTAGGPGFSYAINPYARFFTTVYLQNQRPALSILMRFTPLPRSHTK
jgi:hypothetical protein